MKRILVTMVLVSAGIGWAQSPRAVMSELRGTVEIKAPGSSVWRAAAVGQELERETMVSTGFQSAAVIELGNSTLQVRPLTRLSLGELEAAANNTDRIDITLRAGRIRADVKAPAGGNTEFTVRSPVATASVRGTAFDFDTINLMVNEGTVSFSGADKTAVYVAAGQSSSPESGTGRTAPPEETEAARTVPPPAGVEAVVIPPSSMTPLLPGSSASVGIGWGQR